MGLNPNAPSWAIPLLNPDGTTNQAWFNYLTQLQGVPSPILSVTPGPSPFAYKAPSNGALAVSVGTVSSITLARARVSGVNVGFTSGSISVAANDVVTITYSVAPTVNFIPL